MSQFANLNSNVNDASSLLTAIGNSRRLRILCELAEREASVTQLAESVELSQSALSQHLAKLRALKLVVTRRQAQTIYYSISSPLVLPILVTLENGFSPKETK